MPLYDKSQNDYYSVKVAHIHIISLNLLSSSINYENMIEWIRNELTQVQKLNRWIIILINKPIFHTDEEIDLKMQYIFKEYNADLVITSGGDTYERTFPISQKKIYPFKNFDGIKHHKKCENNQNCDSHIMLEPEAPIYISESYNEITKKNETG